MCSDIKKIPINGEIDPCYHTVQFSAKGGSASGGDGSGLASGVYLYRMQVRPSDPAAGPGPIQGPETLDPEGRSGTESFVNTKKLLLIR